MRQIDPTVCNGVISRKLVDKAPEAHSKNSSFMYGQAQEISADIVQAKERNSEPEWDRRKSLS